MDFDQVRELYQDVILERSRNPRHMHAMVPFDGVASGDNPLCGDQVEVRLRFAADGSVSDVAFEARGCAISLASADLMADAVRGLSPDDIRRLAASFATLAKTGAAAGDSDGLDGLQVLAGVSEYPSRVKCATLPWGALVAALDARRENDDG